MELNRSYSAGCGSALRTVRQAQDRADLAGMWPRLASVVASAVREAATPKPIARTAAVHWNLRACLDLDSTTTNYVRHRRCRPRRRARRARVTFPHTGPGQSYAVPNVRRANSAAPPRLPPSGRRAQDAAGARG